MHRYEEAVLKALGDGKQLDLEELLGKSGLTREEALWAIENLSSRSAIEVKKRDVENIVLTEEGRTYSASKMPEEELVIALHNAAGASPIASLQSMENFMIGFTWAKKNGWVILDAEKIKLTKDGSEIATGRKQYPYKDLLYTLGRLQNVSREMLDQHREEISNLRKRNLIQITKKSLIQSLKITAKGKEELKTKPKTEQIDALSKAAMAGKEWEGKEFKPYDVNIDVEREPITIRHPLRKTISRIKETYLSMGFKEVSGPIIEPAFWVFDSLFMPQDHPAREIQDAFYLSNPEKLRVTPKEYLAKVKAAHLESWGGDWSTEMAEQAMLTTQTTSVSARYIEEVVRSVASKAEDLSFPVKLFSIGRVFRNENIDYRHLTDFYQTDGIVIGNNLTMANLFGVLADLYGSMGMTKIRFKPSYFPFVEPGVEVYAYSEKLNEWVEMCGGGMIRREVSGVPRKNLTVLAWGGGVERMTLLNDPSISSIVELYNNGIGWLRNRRRI